MLNNEPPVTFLMLSFNSRDYIKSALNSAFEQSYDNLEIIVSDDCSTDDTCEIVKRMFGDYAGNKKCSLIENSKNKCTLNNFISATESASGELIVVSAADDISKSDRVSEIVKQWSFSGRPGVVYSDCEIIDESGVVVSGSFLNQSPGSMAQNIFGVKRNDILGCSAAYSAEFVRQVPRIVGRYLFEDSFMNFMSHYYHVNVIFIGVPLVGYRAHSASVSNSGSSWLNFNDEKKNQLKAAEYDCNKSDMYTKIAAIAESDGEIEIARKTLGHSDLFKIKSEWYSYGLARRFLLLSKSKYGSLRKWMIARFFGLNFFVVLKLAMNYVRR